MAGGGGASVGRKFDTSGREAPEKDRRDEGRDEKLLGLVARGFFIELFTLVVNKSELSNESNVEAEFGLARFSRPLLGPDIWERVDVETDVKLRLRRLSFSISLSLRFTASGTPSHLALTFGTSSGSFAEDTPGMPTRFTLLLELIGFLCFI